MKFKLFSPASIFTASAALLLATSRLADAANLTWDANTALTGAQDGSGTWDTTTSTWWTGTVDTTFNIATPDVPTFGANGGPGGTVTLGTAISSGNITFSAPSSGTYTIAGGGNTLTLTARTITANVDATISANIAGTGALTMANSAANAPSAVLTLSGNNSYTAGLSIGVNLANSTAAVRLASSTGAGATAGAITFGGGQGNATSHRLELTGNITVANAINNASRATVAPLIESLSGANTLSGTLTPTSGGSETHIKSDVANGLTFSAANSFALPTGTRNITLRGVGSGKVGGTITGGVANTVTVQKAESGTWTLSGANTYAGVAVVDGGTLVLDYSTQNNSKIPAAGMLGLEGGTLTLSGGSFAQSVGFTVIGPGSSAVTQTGGTSTLAQGAIIHQRGGTVNYGSGIATTTTANVNGILGGYATVGGADWASTNGSANFTITALSTHTDIDALGSTIADGSTSNVRLQTALGTGNISLGAATTTINTLLQNTASAATIDTSPGTLRLGVTGGVLVPSGDQGITFGTSVNSGFLSAGGSTANAAGELIIINNSANPVTVNSIVTNNGTGAVSLTKSGSGALTLTGANVHTGSDTVAAGILNVSADNNLGAVPGAATSGSIVLNGGTLEATSSFTLNANRSITVGPTNGYGNGTIGVAGGSTLTYNGVISNSPDVNLAAASITNGGSLTKADAGTLVLGGANAYTFGTFVNGGTLSVTADNNLGFSPAAYIPDNIDLNGGTLEASNTFTLGINRGIMLGPIGSSGGGTIGVASGQTLTTSTRIADNWGGSGSLFKSDTGTLVLSGGFNDYSGGTTISAGTLKIGNAIAIPNGSGRGDVTNNGILDLNNISISLNGLNGSGVVTNSAATGTQTLTVGYNNAVGAFSGVIASGAVGTGSVALTKTGTGTETLSGVNTYLGTTTISQGTLALSGSGSIATSTNIFLSSGTTLDVSAASFALAGTQVLIGNGTVSGAAADSSGSLIVPGGSNTVGTLAFNNNLTLAGGDTWKFDFNSTTNDVVTVGGSLTPNGVTTINLASLPPGGLANGSYVLFSVSGSLNGTTNNFTVTGAPSPSRQHFGISYNTASSPQQVLLTVSGSAASLVWAPTNTVWDIITTTNWLNAGNADVYFDGDSVNFTDLGAGTNPVVNTIVSPGSVTFSSSSPYLLSGTGKISGSGGLNDSALGTVTIAIPTNDYSGVTTLSSGVLTVTNLSNGGSPSAIGAASAASANLVLNGGDLQYNGPTISVNRGATLAANGGTVEVVTNTNSLTVSGSIAGTLGGGLSKAGNGTLILTGGNTFNGPTTVTAGTLELSGGGTFGTGNVTNNSALLFSGNRTITNVLAGAGTWTNDATGTLSLSGINTFSGAATINGPSGGGLTLLSSSALGNTPSVTLVSTTAGAHGGTRVTLSGGVNTPAGTTLSMPSSFGTIRSDLFSTGTSALNSWNGPIVLNGSDNVQFDGDSGSTLTLAGNVSGNSFVGAMLLRGINGKITGTINLPTGILQVTDNTIWQIAPPVAGANVWSNTTIAFGTLQLGATNALSVIATNLFGQSAGNGIMDLNGFDQQIAGLTISNTASAPAQIITNSSLVNNSTLTFFTTGGSSTFAGVLADGFAGGGKSLSLVVSGGSLALSGTNSFNGTVLVTNGFLAIGNNSALGTTAAGTTVSTTGELDVTASLTVAEPLTLNGTGAGGGGALHQTGGSTVSWTGALTLASDSTIKLDGGCTIGFPTSVDTGGHALTWAGDGGAIGNISTPILGVGGSLTKVTGGSTLNLSAVNTYTGNTTVTGGTLALVGVGSVNNSAQIFVNSGTTLSASGRSDGTLTVVPGQVLAGSSIFNVLGNITNMGTIALNLNKAGAILTNDSIHGVSHITYGGNLLLTLSGNTLVAGDSFPLFSASSYSGSFSSITPSVPAAGLLWDTTQLASNGIISAAAPAMVTVSPSSTNVECSASVTFTANVTGTGPFSYQWYDNSTNAISGQTNATLTLTNVHGAVSGNYTVVVVNDVASATNAGALAVMDTLPPVITILGSNPAMVECHNGYTDAGATALDACVGVVSVNTSGTVDTNTPGTYTITYTATDGVNVATNSRTVIVQDTTPPVITYVFTNLVLSADANCQLVMPDITGTNYIIATDVCSGSVTITQNPTNGALLPLGTNTVILAVADASNNTNYSTNTIVVQDTTAPVITLNGVNPVMVECHSGYIDAGASALDNCSGVVSVTTNNPVDPNTPATYTVTYTATDGAGNIATNTRTVIVQDTTAPVITINGANPATVECHSAYTDAGASALDACVGPVGVNSSGTVDTNTPGTYFITYTATDGNGNNATNTRTVIVQDTTAPVITINGANPATVECHSGYTDAGASALDACAGSVAVSTNGTVNTNVPGTYFIVYTATDGNGNNATNTRTVIVHDTTPPVIAVLGANPFTGLANGSFVDPGATANDACAGGVAVTTNSTVNPTVAGTYLIKYTASDVSGNSATNFRTVILTPNNIAGPYTPDTNTLVLLHFDGPTGASSDTNLGSFSNLNRAFTVTNSVTGNGIAAPSVVTTLLGASAFSGFGNALSIAGTPGAMAGFDANNSGVFQGDVSTATLSPDAVALSNLDIGNGGPTPFTIEALINTPTITSTTNQEIVCMDSDATLRGFQFRVNTAGQLEFNSNPGGVNGGDYVAGIPLSGPNAFVANTWYHVAVTYDGATVRLYWTKVAANVTADNLIGAFATATISTTLGATTGPIIIGNENRNSSTEAFQGKIDEVRVSKIARPANGMLFQNFLNITTQPQKQVVAAGGTATFSVVATTDFAPLTYQWYSNGVALANGGDFSGVTNSTLSIANAQAAYVTTYTCVVSNGRTPTADSVTSVAATLSLARGAAANLTWLGDGAANAWVVGGLLTDWTNAATSSLDVFFPGDLLSFTDISTNPIVNLTGALQPGSINFSANTSNYTLVATNVFGGISGPTGLTAGGNAKVVLGGNNSYTGATAVNAGTLQVSVTSNNVGTGPVLYLSFDNVSGNRVINQGSGGALMDGVIVGTNCHVVPGGMYGNALQVGSGTQLTSAVLINNPVVPLNNTTAAAWTVAMWVKTTAAGGTLLYQGSGGWASGNTVFHLNNGSPDNAGANWGGVRNSQNWEEGTNIINDGNWHFVVMTTAPGNQKILYVDGNVDSFSTISAVPQNGWNGSGVGNQMWIGGEPNNGDGNAPLNSGLIDEVYVYNRALSQAEVQALMTSTNGTIGAPPIPLASPVSVAANSKLDVNGQSLTVASLTGSGTVDTTFTGGAAILAVNNSGSDTFNGAITNSVGSLLLYPTGSGTLTLIGNNGYTGGTVVDRGTLNVTGNLAGGGGTVTVGNGTNNAVLVASGNITNLNYNIGVQPLNAVTTNNAVGAVYVTAGITAASQAAGGANFQIGNNTNAYGYVGVTGGTVTANEIGIGGESLPGNGILEVNGGTVNDAGWVVLSRVASANTQVGMLNIFSGAMTYAGGGVVNDWGSTGQTAIVNVLGGSITNTLATVGFNLNQSANAANIAILNLNGGLAQGNGVGGTAGRLNFNGGTLRSSAASITFINGLTAATIYGGGATINNNGFALTIPQPLLAPAGGGVTGIASFTGGSGYVAPPIIRINRGSGDTTGVGATAVAQINTATGVITNVIITCLGVNYTATPTFTLSGGGASIQGVITGAAPVANTSGGLTLSGSAVDTLTGANTYTGTTAVTAGTLKLSGSGALASTNITVSGGATFDVSAITFTLGATQSLQGFGTNNGSVNSQGSIVAGAPGVAGTNIFNNNLTNSGSAYVALSTTFNGNNGLISVAGNLANNATVVHISAPSTSVNLDSTTDYTLMTAASLSGSGVAVTPVFDVAPLNATHFTLGTNGNSIVLHYNANFPPSGSGTATPSTVVRNQSTFISVAVVSGGGTITNVTLNATAIGGPASLQLSPDITGTNWTNTITIPAGTTPGLKTFVATIQDNVPLSGTTPVTLTVVTGTEVWDGLAGDDNWDSNPNWASGFAPGFVGDSLIFAGNARLTPNMDNSYSVAGLVFSNTAGAFNIGTSASTLTLTGAGVTNFSANPEVLNVPITLGAGQNFTASSGNLTLGQAIAAAGNAVSVNGAFNTALGGTLVSPAAVTVSGAGNHSIAAISNPSSVAISSSGNASIGPITNNPVTLTVTGSGNDALNGAISGAGGLAMNGTGILTVAGNNTFTGVTTVGSGVLNLTGTLTNSSGLETIGTTAANSVLQINGGNLSANFNAGQLFNSSLLVSSAAGGFADLQLASGTLTVFDQLALGNGVGGFGAYSQSSGTATLGGFLVVGFANDRSVFNQNGGVFTMTGSSVTIGAGANSAIGVMNLGGNAVFNANTNGGAFGGGVWPGENGTGYLNISGNALLNIPADSVVLGRAGTAGGSIGFVNLLGGVISAQSVTRPAGTGYLDFNGGTLRGNTNNPAFLTNLTGAFVYSGGAIIDDGGFALTVAQPLVPPTGRGVSSIAVTNGGSGYLDTPVIRISGGTGIGAAAVAQIDPVAGTVTNVQIVNPGTGYTSGDVLTVTFFGGGGTGAGVNTPVLAVNATSGGLTKQGAGVLTLIATNTYGGTTTVSNGTLALGATGSIASSPIINVAAGAVLDVSAVTGGFTLGAGQTLEGNGAINGVVTVAGTVAPGNSIGTLTFSNTPVLNGALSMQLNRTNAQTADLINVAGPLVYGGTLTVLNIGGSLHAGDTFTLFNASGGYSGSFASINLPVLLPGLVWNTANLVVDGTISVGAVPVIVSGPTNATLQCPGSITYTVSATGSGTLSYVWTTNSVIASTGTNLVLSNLHVQAPIAVSVTVSSVYGSATSNATVTIVDTAAPVITVLGANPVTNYATIPFNDPGATANDACAGPVGVITNNPVNVNNPGTYTITYTATDGINTATNTRTVVVLALVQPVITSQQYVGGVFQLTFTGPSNEPYDVLTSLDAAAPLTNWVSVANGSFANSPVSYTNSAPSNSAQFYIIRAP